MNFVCVVLLPFLLLFLFCVNHSHFAPLLDFMISLLLLMMMAQFVCLLMLFLLLSIFPGEPERLCLVLGLDNLDDFVDDIEPVFLFCFFFILDVVSVAFPYKISVVSGEPEPLCLLLGLDARQRRRALPRAVQ